MALSLRLQLELENKGYASLFPTLQILRCSDSHTVFNAAKKLPVLTFAGLPNCHSNHYQYEIITRHRQYPGLRPFYEPELNLQSQLRPPRIPSHRIPSHPIASSGAQPTNQLESLCCVTATGRQLCGHLPTYRFQVFVFLAINWLSSAISLGLFTASS